MHAPGPPLRFRRLFSKSVTFYNGNRTKWRPIRSAIIRVINKIRGRPICLITSMITDRIGRQEVLLPINHNDNEICDVLALLKIKKHNKFKEFSC